MAINPETQYPGKIAPSSAAYPYGQARNVTTPGDGTGTPWEAALVNDLFGFLQAMLSEGSVVPSGSPETATASQYLTALKALFTQRESLPLADIDAVDKTGFYISTGATTGTAPPGGLAGELFHIERGSSNQATQIFDTLVGAGADQQLYTRTKRNDDVWTPWVDLRGSGGVGTFTFLAAGDGTADANSIPGDDPHWLEVSNNPGDGATGNQLFRMNSYGNIAYGNNIHSCRYYGDETTPTAIQNGAFLMSWGFRGYDGTQLSQSSLAYQAEATENWTGSAHGSQFAWETTPNGSTTRTRRMVLDPDGNLLVGATSGGAHSIYKDVADDSGEAVLIIGQAGFASAWYGVTGTGSNTANASLRINDDAGTGRSINASGTINASGADYAEYMRKADGCGTIAKGDVLGIDENGQLTDQFDAALSFAIKSTDPSYVGGDVWGSEEALGRKEPVQPAFDIEDLQKAREADEQAALAQLNEAKAAGDDSAVSTFNAEAERIAAKFDAAVAERSSQYDADMAQFRTDMAEFKQVLEAERQHWDRVAFSGRVPANVDGAAPGDYLVPVRTDSGGIAAEPVKTPTFEQYMIAVGKVASIQEDGRPVVLVKVA
jgi:hypothetical protein